MTTKAKANIDQSNQIYSYYYADPEKLLSLSLKNQPKAILNFVYELLELANGPIVLHFNSALLTNSYHYNDAFELIRKSFDASQVVVAI